MSIDDEVRRADPHRGTALTTVAVVGLGYVGLPTAIALSTAGVDVIGLDVDEARLDVIRHGEPDLSPADRERLRRVLSAPEGFVLTTEAAQLAHADAVIVCVPTPVDETATPDLSALKGACETAVRHARRGQTIILTSTSYVGCTRDLVEEPLRSKGFTPGHDIYVAFAPERIDPGNTRFEQQAVPRVVAGSTPECRARAGKVLSHVTGGVHEVSSLEVAELAKLLENTFRAVNISLANEFADVAQQFGLDPVEVVRAASTKPFGFMPFYPGPGVGGHCIPCDPHYLLWQLRRHHVQPQLIATAMQAIAARPARIVERAAHVLESVGRSLNGARVLVAGVAYKPNIEDTRETPAREIIAGLAARGADVSVYDPLVRSFDVGGTTYVSVPDPSAARCDLVVLCTLHDVMDRRLFDQAPLVLDAAYALPGMANRIVP